MRQGVRPGVTVCGQDTVDVVIRYAEGPEGYAEGPEGYSAPVKTGGSTHLYALH